jgi:hypothetical protein
VIRPAALGLCLGLLVLAGTAPSAAQPRRDSSGETEPDARSLFRRGVEFLQQESYAEALGAFVESYRLDPQPVVLFNIGMCQKAVGDLLAAYETLGRYIDQAGADAPADLLENAGRVLTEIELATGQINLVVDPAGAIVVLDGEELGAAPLGHAVRVATGAHEVEVRSEGRVTQTRTVDVPGGGDPIPVAMRLEAVAPAIAPEPPDDGGTGLAPWAWAAVGLGSAATVAAVITGSLGLVYRDDFVEGGATDADLRAEVVDLGLATDVMIGVAAAGAAAAVVLFVLDWVGEESPPGDEAAGASVAAGLGTLVVTW